jgi:hypothetical protein
MKECLHCTRTRVEGMGQISNCMLGIRLFGGLNSSLAIRVSGGEVVYLYCARD